MPCRDDGYDDGPSAAMVAAAKKYKKEADDATRVACDMARVLRENFPAAWVKISKRFQAETLAWVEKHDQEDAMRIAAEKIIAERKRMEAKKARLKKSLIATARAKLTPEELEAITNH